MTVMINEFNIIFFKVISYFAKIKKYFKGIRDFKIVFLLYTFFIINCATSLYYQPFDQYSESVELIGKNIIYVFEELQAVEMDTKIAKSMEIDSIKPEDFEPVLMTEERLDNRREIIKYLVNYTKLLSSIFKSDKRKEIEENIKIVNKNLEEIGKRHNEFLSPGEIGIMTAISAAMSEALTEGRRKILVKKIMKDTKPVLEKMTEKLKDQIKLTKQMINTYYNDQFHYRVKKFWPPKMERREKYAKIASKLIKAKNKINVILTDLYSTLSFIPITHQELAESLGYKKEIFKGLNELIDYTYRMKEIFEED